MATPEIDNKSNTVKDVEQLGIWAGLASLSYVFWICAGMEMIERFAYYGVRNNAALYATAPVSEGGDRRGVGVRPLRLWALDL